MNHTTHGRRLGSLEHDPGVTLSERDTRGCQLTPADAALMPQAEGIAEAVSALEAVAARKRRERCDVIRLSAPPEEIAVACRLLISPQASRRRIVRAFVDFAAPRLAKILRDVENATG